jgi:hypothetical protein
VIYCFLLIAIGFGVYFGIVKPKSDKKIADEKKIVIKTNSLYYIYSNGNLLTIEDANIIVNGLSVKFATFDQLENLNKSGLNLCSYGWFKRNNVIMAGFPQTAVSNGCPLWGSIYNPRYLDTNGQIDGARMIFVYGYIDPSIKDPKGLINIIKL